MLRAAEPQPNKAPFRLHIEEQADVGADRAETPGDAARLGVGDDLRVQLDVLAEAQRRRQDESHRQHERSLQLTHLDLLGGPELRLPRGVQ